MEFSVLGPVEVRVGGHRVDIGHARQQCVLVVLLIELNQVVPVATLIDRVWGENTPRRARDTLYSYVYRLRQALSEVDDLDLQRRPGGYVITADPAVVDLHRFRGLVAQARGTEDDERAAALFTQALRLWRGEPFAALDTPWLNWMRTTIDAEQRAAELDHTDVELRRGRHADLLARLAARAAEHPLEERLAGQLMLALYRDGRQADAQRVYQRTRTALVEELGVEPGAELLDIHQRILNTDPALVIPARNHDRGLAKSWPTPRELPADTAHFTGRDQHLADLHTLLDHHRETGFPAVMITAIEGTAGIGKTTLAIHFGHQIANQFPDGQLYLDLRGFAPTPPMTAGEALGRLLRSLGLPPERIPADEQEQAATYRSLLADKRMLLVLDNARRAEQIQPLLPGSPHCLVVATSRSTLTTVDGATHLHLDVLSEREALTLLARIAGQDRVSAEPDAAATLVDLCARLPLAIRIAGARLAARPGWTIRTVVARLADEHHRLDELRVGGRAVRAAFAVSYDALQTSDDLVDQTAARAFRFLGLLEWVDMSVPVAAALIDRPQPDTHAALERLVDDHLLTSHLPGRYRTHDLLRIYARQLASHEPAPHAALSRALYCYIDAGEQATRRSEPHNMRLPAAPIRSPHGGFTLSTLADTTAYVDVERPNMIAIMHQAATAPGLVPAHAVRLAAAWYMPLDFRGYWQDLAALCECAAQIAHRVGDRPGEAVARQDLGMVYSRVGRPTEAIDMTRQALEIYRDIGDRSGEQRCLHYLGFTHHQQHRLPEAVAYLEEGLAICQEIGYRPGEASQLDTLGLVHQRLHRFDQAIACHQRALTIGREDGHRRLEATALVNLGWAHHRAKHHDQAIAHFQQCLTLERDLGRRYGEAEALWGLGQSHHALGHHDQARSSWERSIAILHDIRELTDDEAASLLGQPIPKTPGIIQLHS